MASQIQLVMYEGYLADTPEMRYTPTGTPVTNFRMGSHRTFTTKEGQKVKETTWLKVAAWGKLGEIVNKYCDTGSHVVVKGILRVNEKGNPNAYVSKDGSPAASFEITADEIRIIKGKALPESGEEEYGGSSESADEIPF